MVEKMSSDIAVIGSGPGGAVTATLCAEAGHNVLMIEEGPHLPLDSAAHFSHQEMLQKYRGGGVGLALGRAMIAYVEGRCVGGGSEVNRGLYHRTPGVILERWRREFAAEGLMPEALAPHFAACEATARVEFLPGDAPLMSSRLADGARALGWEAIEAQRLFRYGGPSNEGRKQSMSETFVPRFLRAGGRLIAETRVSRLRHSGGKWHLTARRSREGGPARQVEITAENIFVACGAVMTPSLLRRSGIKRNIGNSLRFHPMLKAVALFDTEVNRSDDLDPVHQIKAFEPRFSMGCSFSKRPTLALAMTAHPEHMRLVESDWKRMGIYYVQNMSAPAYVRNLPGFRDPLVVLRHDPAQLAELAEGLKRLCEALFAAGAVRVFPGVEGYPVLHSPSDIAKLPDTVRGTGSSLTSVHVFSSCPMGEDRSKCATDSFGRVQGAEGLYLADASLLCGPTMVNPQGTVMAIAHRNAMHAIERRFH
ncbi:MAG: GMC family oxidoreductase [Alphaproteobacteria bacterium]|nr:GMC family oxidoreductase [Alphaproteobacteria bacterium]